MDDQSYQFYECDDPDCRLRFPGNTGSLRWSRCPVCRSSIHLVATLGKLHERLDTVNGHPLHQVEAILDNIRSAWNVGSIFRSADGTGIKKLYLCGITPSPDTSKVSKTALGAERSIPWEKQNNGVLLANRLIADGYRLWALEATAKSKPLFGVKIRRPDSPTVLVVGNEVTGIDPGILDLCDEVIAIPMVGNKKSYNVAVAFGIAASFLLYLQNDSHGSRNTFPNT